MGLLIPQVMDLLIWSLMSGPSALSCPCLKTSALSPSCRKNPARPCATTRRDSTFGPTSSAPCPCLLAPTAGWWTSARVPLLKLVYAMHLWSAKGLGMRPGWATTVTPGCYRTMLVTTPSSTRGKKCPYRLLKVPRGSVCCWTGPLTHCCSMSQTPVLCSTHSPILLAPRCCQRVQWLTAASPYCTDWQSKEKRPKTCKTLPKENVIFIIYLRSIHFTEAIQLCFYTL